MEECEQIKFEPDLVDFVLQFGPEICNSLETCRNTLVSVGIAKVTPPAVARIMNGMLKALDQHHNQSNTKLSDSDWGREISESSENNGSNSGGEQPWNLKVFVQAIIDLIPGFIWKEVFHQLDFQGFSVRSTTCFRALLEALKFGLILQGQTRPDQFPVEAFYRVWNNHEAQVGLLKHCLNPANYEVFSFADFPYNSVPVDILKSSGDKGSYEGKEISTWKSLQLIELCLRLSDLGHYPTMLDLFQFPLVNCPDILCLGLSQLNIPMNVLRTDLLTSLFPIFLGAHVSSGVILQHAWHVGPSSIRPVLISTMAQWYLSSDYDQARLSRILDIAQDLKALPLLLNANSHGFIIDLACLASRREFLKLDKWLGDKIRDHGEPFIINLVKTVTRRVPQLAGKSNSLSDFEVSSGIGGGGVGSKGQTSLPPEVINIIITTLVQTVGKVGPDLSETIMSLSSACNSYLNKPRGPLGLGQGQLPQSSQSGPQQQQHQQSPNLQGSTGGQIPGILRPHRSMDPSPFTSSPTLTNPNQLFSSNPLPPSTESLSNLGSTLAGLNLAGVSGSGSSFGGMSLNGPPTPGSPSRLLGPNFSAPPPQQQASSAPFSLNPPNRQQNSSTPPIGGSSGNPFMGMGMSRDSSGGGSNRFGLGNPGTFGLGPGIGANSTQQQQQAQSNVGPNSGGPGIGAPLPPQLQNRDLAAYMADSRQLFTEIQAHEITKEAEDEANSYFHRIYSKPPDPSMSIDEVLELLKKFQDSSVRREREVFVCMLRNLFEEYKFFPQYPDKELHTTAQLFGGIIEHGLVTTYLQLGVALRFVVDAIKKPPGTKMYYFGIAALDRFKTKLKDYPQYSQHLTTIPHFTEFPAILQEFIEFGARSQEPPSVTTNRKSNPSAGAASLPVPTSAANPITVGGSATNAGAIGPKKSAINPAPGSQVPFGRPSIANSTNINTLLVATERDEKITAAPAPPEPIQDKTAFIFNNLNQMNLPEKSKELKELLGENYWLWMSQYLVMKRASIELNFHTLYANLLDALANRPLYQAVVKETHRNIQILLRTDKSASNFSDRSLLKNLGHWLGMITLMKNRPINMDDLDIKSLIVEAYRKGIQDLLYVVPFAAKIMESCSRSHVFRPPCPWTMAILNVLAELHKEPDMKLNLKFEIEVLCKALSMEIYELKPSAILKEDAENGFKIHVRQLSYSTSAAVAAAAAARTTLESEKLKENQGRTSATATPNPPDEFPNATAPSSAIPGTPPPLAGTSASAPNILQTAGQIGGPVLHGLSSANISGVASEPKFSYLEIDTSNLGALLSHVNINHNLPLFQANPSLKHFVRTAVEKTIHDLLLPVVDRSIKYTINACESIIKKDFALDPDETRLRIAAHSMMRYLTAGMAMITSRDHIFISIKSNLQQVFTNALRSTATNPQIKDLIESACSTLAQDNVEIPCVFIQKTAVEKGQLEIDKRLLPEIEARKQAKIEGRRFMDPNMLAYQGERVPEQVRVKPGNMMGIVPVYEDFARGIPGFLPPTDSEIPFINPLSKYAPAGPSGRLVDLATAAPASQSQQQNSGATTTGTAQSSATATPSGPAANDELLSIYDKLITQMENYLQELSLSNSPITAHLHGGVSLLADLIHKAKISRSIVAAITLLQKAVEGLLEGIASFPSEPEIIRFRDAHLMVLKALQDPRAFGEQWVNRQVTKTLIETRSELKYNVEAVDTLIRSNLVNLLQFDAYLSNALEKGNNLAAMNFAIPLVRMYCVEERFNLAGINEGDFFHTADILSRCATMNRNPPEGLIPLVEALRLGGNAGNSAQQQQQSQQQQQQSLPEPTQQQQQQQQQQSFGLGGIDRITPAHSQLSSHLQQSTGPTLGQAQREFDDPTGIVEKSEILLREWIRLFLSQGTPKDSSKPFASFINELNLSGILKSDDSITRFFRISVQCCVTQVYQGLQNTQLALSRSKLYQASDALTRLVALLIRHIGDNTNPQPKVNLLNKFLGIVAGVLIQDHDMQKTDFQQLPFHRMFIMLFYDLIGTDPVYETITMHTLTGFSNTMHILNPTKVPGFAYAWLEIVGNRGFIARMLALASEQKCWAMYCQLLLDLFKFLQPFMRNADMPGPVGKLYRGSLRVLLVVLHDFPDFLCDYCYHFLDAIPPNCIQMRNLVLSAFPRNMRLPDPFTANLKFEMLADTSLAPRILSNVAGQITPPAFKKELDSYLKTRAPVTFLSELRTNLQTQQFNGEPVENRYNIPLLNSLVLYVGSQHIGAIRGRGQTPSLSTVAHTSHMDIFQNLAVDLDTEGRYLFLNALANQLRFPSSHTHYFSLIILYLFAQSNTEVVQEQITRVLLERLVVNRPHPWGLLVTFIELIKNQQYKFWNHEFVHCAPEVEKLFESVARSCMVTKTPPVGGIPPSGTTTGTTGQITINGPGVGGGGGLNFAPVPQSGGLSDSGGIGLGGTGGVLDPE